MRRWLSGSAACRPSILSLIDHVFTTVPVVEYSIERAVATATVAQRLVLAAQKEVTCEEGDVVAFEALAGAGAAVFVIENPATTDGVGPDAATAAPAELKALRTTAASTAAASAAFADGRWPWTTPEAEAWGSLKSEDCR